MFCLEAQMAHKGKAGAVMPPRSLCGKAGERCCRWLHQQGGTSRVGRALDPLQACCCSPLSFPSGFQNPSPHPAAYVSAPSQLGLPSPQDPTVRGGELCPEPQGHLRQGRAALLSVRAGAGRDYRSQHAAACLLRLLRRLLLRLLRRTWPGAGRDAACGIGAGVRGACAGGAGDTAPAASLQVKPWEKWRSSPCCAARTGRGQGRPAVPPGR